MAWEDRSDKKYIRYVNEVEDGTGLTVYRDRSDPRPRVYNAALVYQDKAEPVRMHLNIDTRTARQESDLTPALVQQFATQRMSDYLLSGQKEAQRKLDMCLAGLSCMEALSVAEASRQKGAPADAVRRDMAARKELPKKTGKTASEWAVEMHGTASQGGTGRPGWVNESVPGSDFYRLEVGGVGLITVAGDPGKNNAGMYGVMLRDAAQNDSYIMRCRVHPGDEGAGITATDVYDTVMRELGCSIGSRADELNRKLGYAKQFLSADTAKEQHAFDKAAAFRECFAKMYLAVEDSCSIGTRRALSEAIPASLLQARGSSNGPISMDESRTMKPVGQFVNADASRPVHVRRIPEIGDSEGSQMQSGGPEF